MTEQVRLHCSNCGSDFTPPLSVPGEPAPAGYTCPVCQFYVTAMLPSVERQVSASDLASQLDNLIAEARESGVPLDDITRVLRDELEFQAELTHTGRRLMVQIIDLGPQTLETTDPVAPDRRELLHNRSLPA